MRTNQQEIFAAAVSYAKSIDGEVAIEKAREQKRAEQAAAHQNAATNGNGHLPKRRRAKSGEKR